MKRKTIKVDYLARVEGEGSLFIKYNGSQVEDVKLKIFEPPRFFEAFLRGRNFREAPDITARICGICPVAYQMSAVHAIEQALNIQVTGSLRELRRLLYCGEWIESHTLHVTMLHAPDFLGYQDAIQMAKTHPEAVQRGLQIKKVGNAIVTLVGGREIHPINVKVGGFYRIPSGSELKTLIPKLQWAYQAANETLEWVSRFDFPEFEYDYTFVALQHPDEYPFNEGQIVSNKGLNICQQDYESHFIETQVPYSNALQSTLINGEAYLVGPMARYSLNFDRLPPDIQASAQQVGLESVCRNPFKSILVRCIEIMYACHEALRIIENYVEPSSAAVEIIPQAAIGSACTEAPRGLLYHRYQLDQDGTILKAQIIPPTSQNQKSIEDDLRLTIPQCLNLSDEALTWRCEQAIRNYDPCISCATHFLKLKVER